MTFSPPHPISARSTSSSPTGSTSARRLFGSIGALAFIFAFLCRS